jgi:hypothetical protein
MNAGDNSGPAGLRPVADVTDEPRTTLLRWRVMSTRQRTHHFVGWALEAGTGRVSSYVVAWDPKRKLGRTSSGRLYELRGQPGCDADGAYVWTQWLRAVGVEEGSDVTALYAQEPREAVEGNA